uniref:MD-2-related lipid-recognition domain-containing protein n=1 Tax=Percolomonas cosmopolitus TaxID=63605 RepID=A0A7S1KSQ8_9EUKA
MKSTILICLVGIFATLLIALTHAENVDFALCTPPDQTPQPYEITSLDMNPASPHPGDTVEITITGTAHNGTTGGSLTSEISKGGIKLFTFTYDLCESAVGGCPIAAGPCKIVLHQSTPRFAFPGEYQAVNHAADSDGKPLSCAEFKFNVVKA